MDSNDSTVLDEEDYKNFLEDAIAGKYFKDSSFAELQLEVIKEKEAFVLTKEDEENLFNSVGKFLRFDPRFENDISIITLQKLVYIPPTTPVERLKEIANVVCDKVFNPTSHHHDIDQDDDMDEEELICYSGFCKAIAFLKATVSEVNSKPIVTFEEVLIDLFLEKLSFRFSFRQRFQDLAKHYKGPEEKKKKWIFEHTEEYNRKKRVADPTSIEFLSEMYTLYPEIVFRVVEFLLSTNEQTATQYLWALLDSLQGRHLEDEYWEQRRYTNIRARQKNYLNPERNQESVINLPIPKFNFHTEKKDLTHVIENINKLSERNDNITLDLKNLLNHVTEDGFLKDNYPQDYIRYKLRKWLRYRSLPGHQSLLKSWSKYDLFSQMNIF